MSALNHDDSNKPRTIPSVAGTYDVLLDSFIDYYIADIDDRYESWDEIIPHLKRIQAAIINQIGTLDHAIEHVEDKTEYKIALENALANENRLQAIIKIADHDKLTPGDKEYFIQTIWALRGH